MSPHIEKIPVPIRLSQPNSSPRDGHLLLFANIGSDDRPETLIELLNSTRDVIPFIQADDSSVLLLSRTNIDWVAVGSSVPDRLITPPSSAATHEQAVLLRFVDESRVDATIRWRADGTDSRLSDYFNLPSTFVVALAGFGVLLVNKHRIRETRIKGTAIEGRQPEEGHARRLPTQFRWPRSAA